MAFKIKLGTVTKPFGLEVGCTTEALQAEGCKTQDSLWIFLQLFSSEVFLFKKINCIVRLISLPVKVLWQVHWRMWRSPKQELLLSPSTGRFSNTPGAAVVTSSIPSRWQRQVPALTPSQPHCVCPLWQLAGRVGVTGGGRCALSPATLKILVIAQKFSFIHISWIPYRCSEWIWLQSGGSKFGLLQDLIEESSTKRDRNEKLNELRDLIWELFLLSLCSWSLSPWFTGYVPSSSV